MTNIMKKLEQFKTKEIFADLIDYVIDGKLITIAYDIKPLILVIGEIGMTKEDAAMLLGIPQDSFKYEEELPFD